MSTLFIEVSWSSEHPEPTIRTLSRFGETEQEQRSTKAAMMTENFLVIRVNETGVHLWDGIGFDADNWRLSR